MSLVAPVMIVGEALDSCTTKLVGVPLNERPKTMFATIAALTSIPVHRILSMSLGMSTPSPSSPTVLDRGLPSEGPMVAHAGMRVANRYRLVARRGRGGIGEVWEAEQLPTGRRVAIKLLLPLWQTDPNVRKRFVREGRLASTVQHRNIVDIFDVGESGGQPYIAMELLEGPSLDQVVLRSGPMPWERVKRILLQLCGALDHAHGLKIVHRDVKPSNVVLASRPGDPDRCMLVDFGIAKQSLVHPQTHLTGEGQLLGSPGFMSPEQLQGRPTDIRGDIYGLGCTGYYLLTGQVPFAGGSVPEMIHNALYESPRSLEGIVLDDELRKGVEAVFLRAIHRSPDERFESILDLVVALNHVGEAPAAPIWSPRRLTLHPPTETPSEPLPEPSSSAAPVVTAPAGASESSGTAPVTSPTRGLASTLGHSWLLTGRSTFDRVDWVGATGFVELARMPPDIVLVHMSGVIESGAAKLFHEQLGSLLERSPPTQVFWHLATIKTYASDVRDATLRCLTEHRDSIESMHVLNGPGLVGMAVSLAAVALGGQAHVYEDQGLWRTALDSWSFGRRG
jgi:serine/threonine protein kinase